MNLLKKNIFLWEDSLELKSNERLFRDHFIQKLNNS